MHFCTLGFMPSDRTDWVPGMSRQSGNPTYHTLLQSPDSRRGAAFPGTQERKAEPCAPPSRGFGHQDILSHQGSTQSSPPITAGAVWWEGRQPRLTAPRHGARLLICHPQGWRSKCAEAVLRVGQLQTAGTSPWPAAGTAGPGSEESSL